MASKFAALEKKSKSSARGFGNHCSETNFLSRISRITDAECAKMPRADLRGLDQLHADAIEAVAIAASHEV